MEFLNPTALVALGTLIILEVVLGIDNLVFIAILSEKLPPEQRSRARLLGLGLALLMRLILLYFMSLVMTLTKPIFTIYNNEFSGRDLILLVGGFFLLYKATTELHERMEGAHHTVSESRGYANFWVVIFQIVALDAVFSLDSIVTAVGMTQHLEIMMTAVIIAMLIMIMAANPLTSFVNKHPTVIILCLSFLLLIGLSLIAEGFGVHIPKGYLYAAIGFSVLIEFFNQIAQHNVVKHERRKPLRMRTAEAVLGLLGGGKVTFGPIGKKTEVQPETESTSKPTTPVEIEKTELPPLFVEEEVNMVGRVLSLAERTVRSIMTHRMDTDFIDLDDPAEEQKAKLLKNSAGFMPVCRGSLDDIVGVGRAANLLGDILTYGQIHEESLEEPLVLPQSMRILRLFETLRHYPNYSIPMVFVANEFGSIEGVISSIDLLEAITGDPVDQNEPPDIRELTPDSWLINGTADTHFLEYSLDLPDIVSESDEYTSLAGFILAQLGRIPEPGDSFEHKGFRYTVEKMENRRVTLVKVEQLEE